MSDQTKTLKFHGYSDDAFGHYEKGGDDYDNCASDRPIRWKVFSPSQNHGLIVVGHHCHGDTDGWLVGVAPFDPTYEDRPIPAWPMRIDPPGSHDASPYTPVLLIEAPEDVEIECLEIDDE